MRVVAGGFLQSRRIELLLLAAGCWSFLEARRIFQNHENEDQVKRVFQSYFCFLFWFLAMVGWLAFESVKNTPIKLATTMILFIDWSKKAERVGVLRVHFGGINTISR